MCNKDWFSKLKSTPKWEITLKKIEHTFSKILNGGKKNLIQ